VRYFRATPATYTRIVAHALELAPCLEREGFGAGARIALKNPDSIPPWASCGHLLDEIAFGNDPRITGLAQDELPVFIPNWTNNLPSDPAALTVIIQARAEERPVRIYYVGLRAGEEAKWRAIYPIGLERMGDQWRLIANDLEKEGYPLRTFVLARIVRAEACEKKRLPPDLPPYAVFDRTVKIEARPNPRLTPDQVSAVNNELGIVGGALLLHERSVFEFFRRFGAQPLSANAVWPVLMNKKE